MYIPQYSSLKSAAAAAAKSLQSCPTLCNPIDGSPPGSPVPEILQVKTLEWVAISFSNAWKWKVKVKSLSSVRLLATPRTAAYPAPPSMGVSRQEYQSGLPLPSPDPVSQFIPFLPFPPWCPHGCSLVNISISVLQILAFKMYLRLKIFSHWSLTPEE